MSKSQVLNFFIYLYFGAICTQKDLRVLFQCLSVLSEAKLPVKIMRVDSTLPYTICNL